jgi:hypothetical protein
MKPQSLEPENIQTTIRSSCYIILTFVFAIFPSILSWYTGEKLNVITTWFLFSVISFTLGSLATRKYYIYKCETIKTFDTNTSYNKKRY